MTGIEVATAFGMIILWAVTLGVIIWYRRGATLTFRVKCPCCEKEIVVDTEHETAHLPTFRDK